MRPLASASVTYRASASACRVLLRSTLEQTSPAMAASSSSRSLGASAPATIA